MYVSFYPDQTRKINEKSLSGPMAKIGSEWERNFVKNERSKMGKGNQKYTEMQTFLDALTICFVNNLN